MGEVVADFISDSNSGMFVVHFNGLFFRAPVNNLSYPPGEVVRPFQDHVLRMQPLSDMHHIGSSLPSLCARILNDRAKVVEHTVFYYPLSANTRLCFLVMVAWYLVDDEASLSAFYRRRHLHNYKDIDVAVWAAVLTFRNFHVLRRHMSDEALRLYTGCFNELVRSLKRESCSVHTSYEPID
jgi:hypothetical protein